MITATDLSLWIGNRELLHKVNFTINPKQRVALVGANGTGKTTLLNALRQGDKERFEQFASTLSMHELRMAWVEQEVPNTDQPALEYVMHGDLVYSHWLEKLNQALEQQDNELIALANSKLDDCDAWTLESRASIILHGLGFTQEQLQQPVNSLSGGWRIRLNLARALLVPSDLLLLDEPTNHLDIDAIYWLEQYLKSYHGTIIFISHDQEFMDNLADHVLHLANNTITSYAGNYSSFVKQREQNLIVQEKQYKEQQKHIKQVQRFIDRFKAKAKKASQAQSRVKYLQKLELIDPVVTGSPFSFHFAASARLPSVLATFRKANLGYLPQKPVLQEVNFQLLPQMRIGLLGLNGAGKSTLIKAFAGELGVHEGIGVIELNPLVQLGYFNQYVVDKLDITASPMELLKRLDPKISDAQARGFLGGFNFKEDKVFEAIEHFSGGEKSRMALALIVYQKPNLLLLDEPTNHLDLEMRQALALALQEFEGSLIVVSHDRFLLQAVVQDFYLVDSGRVTEFDGDLNDYHNWVIQKKSQALANDKALNASQSPIQGGHVTASMDQDAKLGSHGGLAQGTAREEVLSSSLLDGNAVATNKTIASGASGSFYLPDGTPNYALLKERLEINTRLNRQLQKDLLPLTRRQNQVQEAISKLQEQVHQIEVAFTDMAIVSDGAKVTQLNQQLKQLQSSIEEHEEEWMEIELEIETMTQEFLVTHATML